MICNNSSNLKSTYTNIWYPLNYEYIARLLSAITATIAKNAPTDLKFLVNNKEELTKSEFEEKYEGYTVNFLFNTSALSSSKTTGNVTASSDFKYAVQVTDPEGNKLPEVVEAADYAEVKVADPSVPVSIDSVALSNELDYLTVGADNVTFAVTAAKNALGEDLAEEDLQALTPSKVVSSDTKVAYYADNKIVVRTAGNVTFTITYGTGENAITVDFAVEVKESGVASSIEAADQTVAAGTAVTALDFKVFDQHGLDITSNNAAYKVVIKDSEGLVVGDLELVDTYTVTITDLEDKVLGSFNVTTVDVQGSEYESFSFVEDDEETVLDVNADPALAVKTKTLTVKGVKSGVTVVADDLTIKSDADMATDGYYLVSSDEEVVTVGYAAGTVTITTADSLNKAATAEVQLIKVAGDIQEVLATYEVVVNNTTPVIDTLTLKDKATSILVKDSETATLEAKLKEVLTAGTKKNESGEDEEIFDYDSMVESITFIPGNNIVEVKVQDIYGGKTFEFNVTIDDVSPAIKSFVATVDGVAKRATIDEETGAIALEVEHNSVTEKIVVTFSEAVVLPEGIIINMSVGAAEAVEYGTATLSEDGKVLTVTPTGANGTAGVAQAVVTFTLVDGEGHPVTKFTDLAGNEVSVPTITLTVGEEAQA